MDRLVVPRMFAAGSVASAATALRLGIGCAALLVQRGPGLVRLGAEASLGRSGAPHAQAAFRDELVGLARESAETSWRELRRGVQALDATTRPTEPRRPQTGGRLHRVKP